MGREGKTQLLDMKRKREVTSDNYESRIDSFSMNIRVEPLNIFVL